MNERVCKDTVGIDKGLLVDKDFFVANFDFITTNRDHPLDIIEFWIHRKLKHDNIVDFGLGNRNERGIGKGQFHAVDKFVDQDMITNL